MRKIIIVFGLLLITQFGFSAACAFTCGDANGDGGSNLGDGIFIVNYIFFAGPAPNPIESGDATADGGVNIGDASHIYNYVFAGGPQPGSTIPCDDSPFSTPASDPGTADTITIESKTLPPGVTEFTVDVNLYTDNELAAFDIPLVWNLPDINLESISWTGSVVESWGSKSYQIDAGSRKCHVGAMAYFDTRISPGSYLLFSATFSIGPGAEGQAINIDTAFYSPASELYLTLSSSSIIYPQFVPGEISPEAPIVVSNLDDAGDGSLRWAIDSVNNSLSAETITFSISGTLQPATALPTLTSAGNAIIQGSTAPGGVNSFIIDGSAKAVTGSGITIQNSNNYIEGLTITGFSDNGIEVTGVSSTGNTFSNNLIYNNGLLGIDLGDDGVTPNDAGDVDTGPNDLLNFPVKDSAFSQEDGTYSIYGKATPSSIVEMFVAHPANDATRPEDATGYGEAYFYLENVTADPSGEFEFIDLIVDHFSVITMTATDVSGNTSEFGANFLLMPAPLIVVAYSPVNIIIEDPNGFRYGKDADGLLIDEISPAEYHDLPNDSVVIGQPILGDYIISFVTETGADPNSTYSAIIKVNGTLAVMIVIGAQVPDAGIANSYTYTFGERGYYENGDSNGDESINLGDAGFIVNYIFYDGPAPDPLLSGDANCDMTVNLADAGYIINYIFYDGSPPCYFAP